MQVIWANEALTSTGWQRSVRLEIGQDRIVSVTPDAAPEGHRVDLLLPAPVNLHSHAFQRAMAGMTERRGPDPSDSFWTWRRLMYRFLDALSPDDIEAITAFVQMEMAEAGYACVGEFHYLHHQPGGVPYDDLAETAQRVAAAAEITGLGLTLLPVLYQYGGCDRRPLGPGQIRFGNDPDRFATLADGARAALADLPEDTGFGIAPHSLRAVGPEGLAAAVALADGPIHMHLAEQLAEVEEVEAAWGARPTDWLLAHTQVDPRWCLIHCTQMLPHETEALAATGAVAGLSPITESSLGDGIFDGPRFRDAGGRFGIGSDSNIRISLTEELRTLEYSQRLRDRARAVFAEPARSTGRVLLETVVAGGAQAAGRDAGSIAPGKLADLLAVSTDTPDLDGATGDTTLDTHIFAGSDADVSDLWSAGRHIVTEGRHTAHEAITARYRRTMSRLRDII